MPSFEKTGDFKEKREKEKAAALFALKALLNAPSLSIVHDEYHKPRVPGQNCHISISHSFDKLAVIQHQTISTGIDIEKVRDKIQAVQHKFLTAAEINDCNGQAEQLTLYWAIKEAIYKAYGKKNLVFNEHMLIPYPPANDSNRIIAHLNAPLKECVYELQFEFLEEGYVLAYIINEMT